MRQRRLPPLLAVALLTLALLGSAVSRAHARVMMVATGAPAATLLDVQSGALVEQIPTGAPVRAVAISPDGARGFALAGAGVVALDLNQRARIGDVQLSRSPTALAIAAGGSRLVAALRGSLNVIDPNALTVLRTIQLGARAKEPAAVAVSADGAKAVVVIDRERIAIVDLLGGGVRRVRLAGVTGVAFAPTGRNAYALSVTKKATMLVKVDTALGKLGRSIRTKPGPGGGVAVLGDGKHVVAGAGAASRVTAVFDLTKGRVAARVATGRGPGHPAVAPDGVRLYVGDQGGRTISVLSALSFRVLSTRRLTAAPLGLAIQDGLGITNGTDGADRLTGTRLGDQLNGLGGDDVLVGGRGADLLYGGLGNDTLDGGSDNDKLYGEDANDRLFGRAGNDALDGGTGNDYANGGTGDDEIDGGDGDDSLDGGDGDDVVKGGAGNDRIVELGLGNDLLLDGGAGNDYVDGNRGNDAIDGGDGDDTLLGGSGSERIDGGDGNDSIDGGTGGDTIFGRTGADSIRGDAGRDTLYGSEGDDTIDGGSGDDRLSGGDGNDEIVAGPGADTVSGGAGRDQIRVADGDHDVVDCGPGRDTVYVEEDAPTRDTLKSCEVVIPVPAEPATDAPPPTNNIFGTVGNDTLFGTEGPDSLFGNDGNDILYGNGGDDYVDGENGDDELHGGAGDDALHGRGDNDVILGNEGNDTITGDRGNDTINGGPGNDDIYGNLDDDIIAGDEGDDRINVVGGGFDRVSCGDGRDTVFADVTDEVAADCEDVRR